MSKLRSLLSVLVFAPAAFAADPTGEPLSLSQAIEQALAKNFAIKVEGYDAAIAAARVTESLGKFDPVLSGSYTNAANRNPLLTFDTTTGLRNTTSDESDSYDVGVGGLLPWGMTYRLGASTTNARGTFNAYTDNFDSFAGVSGTQPLLRDFGFGPTMASIRIARTNRAISDWQFKQAVIDTITRVTFAYHDLNFAHAYLRSATRSRDLAAGLLDENEKRFKVGSMSEYDVTSAKARVASREENVLSAERQVRDAENFLKQLITDDKTPALLDRRLAIDPPPPAPIVLVDPATDFRTALEKRPDYQQAKLALQRSDLNARLQRNQLLPRLDLVGSYGHNGLDEDRGASRRQVQDKDYRSYSWGVVMSVPLTFTTERGRYRAAKLAQRQSATQLEQVEQAIVVSVGNAAGQIETAQKRIQANRRAREHAQATLDAEVKRLRVGQSSTFFVAQQQELLSIAEVREAAAMSDYHKALAEYDRQLGLTLEKLNVTVEPPK
ncbi:TolC family protein [Oleiharenicola lentus]|uniref:TolC family protein n=1 Tax=Oleiharenicola lentus TaxID=2508720 RepID=A0A4Q1CB29_9BACT|nr:TolC family protein [Oleiharenicola lentus]RXK56150.1 TolC family protein [Oleiharenicola lentus]